MKGIRDEITDLPEWVGELYLELHRGTLTSKAKIKRGNRKLELALREAEFLNVLAKLNGEKYPEAELHKLWEILLVNQFHDILPGSSIVEVNEQAVADYEKAITEAEKLSKTALETLKSSNPPLLKGVEGISSSDGVCQLLLANSLSWTRSGEMLIEKIPAGFVPDDDKVISQRIKNIDNKQFTAIKGIEIPACGTTVLQLKKLQIKTKISFAVQNIRANNYNPFR